MESLTLIHFHTYYNWYIFNATVNRNELYGLCDITEVTITG